jgi:hypothetical protein
LNDHDELVRAQAFKGLGEVRKALRYSANQPELRASIVKVNPEEPASSLIATVCNDTGQPIRAIPPTGFILRGGTPARPARHFTVEEYDCRSSLSVAFVLCLPGQEEAAAEEAFGKAIEACNTLRRSKDRWTIVKISPKLQPVRNRVDTTTRSDLYRARQKWSILHVDFDPSAIIPAQETPPFEYTNVQTRIDAMLRESPVMIGAGANDDAASVVINSLLRGDTASGNPHILFFGSGPHPHLIEPLQARGPELPACVHVLAQSPAWRSEACQNLARATSGTYQSVDTYNTLSKTCFETYSSLLHHYRINWKETPVENLELEVRCEEGRAAASYGPSAVAAMPNAISA